MHCNFKGFFECNYPLTFAMANIRKPCKFSILESVFSVAKKEGRLSKNLFSSYAHIWRMNLRKECWGTSYLVRVFTYREFKLNNTCN